MRSHEPNLCNQVLERVESERSERKTPSIVAGFIERSQDGVKSEVRVTWVEGILWERRGRSQNKGQLELTMFPPLTFCSQIKKHFNSLNGEVTKPILS